MRFRLLSLVVLVGCGGAEPAPVATGPRVPVTPAADEPAAPAAARPPLAERRVVTDTYHGVTVEDPYRWLEGSDAEVEAWSDAQNAYARAQLEALPEVDALAAEYRAIFAAPIVRHYWFRPAGGKVFALRKDPAKEQSELVVLDRPEDAAAARLILDPAAEGDKTRAIDWFVPSPDGTKVAVSLSVGGSEAGTLHVFDLDGKLVDAPIEGVQHGTGGGDVAWRPDGKGFWYTRYPREGEKPDAERRFWLQVWWHELGKAEDRYELGKDLTRISEIMLETDRKGRVLARVQEGDGGTFQHYLRDPRSGAWRRVTDFADEIVHVGFGPTDDLWLVSRKGAPRGKILRLPAKATSLAKARLIVPEGKDSIVTNYYDEDGLVVTRDRLFVVYQVGGPTELRAFTHAGKPAKAPAMPAVSTVGLPQVLPDGDLLGFATSYVIPPTMYRIAPKTGAGAPIAALSPPPPVSLDGFEVHREWATSKDGTKVPVNIVWPAGRAKDGSTPCVVSGYGGYGLSISPYFVASSHPLLSRGVCAVFVNLRGGSEFGAEWHDAGRLTRKQNVFDDFAAALDLLVAGGWSRPERLAIRGGSNGGLLMGAIITQHPDKVKAVVSHVGIYDMLRVELSPNGAYNVPEFGTVAEKDQFEALYAYSPYHRVVDGTRYPAVLMTTGANDPRVEPWHSRKMIAALQAAQAGDAPILLLTSDSAGHGAGTAMSERIAESALVAAFLLAQLRG